MDAAHEEIRILHAAQGRGYVRLIVADEDRNILLMERLHNSRNSISVRRNNYA